MGVPEVMELIGVGVMTVSLASHAFFESHFGFVDSVGLRG